MLQNDIAKTDAVSKIFIVVGNIKNYVPGSDVALRLNKSENLMVVFVSWRRIRPDFGGSAAMMENINKMFIIKHQK